MIRRAIAVNGQQIPWDAVSAEMERMRAPYEEQVRSRNKASGDGELRDWAEENLIEQELLRQAAAAELPESERADRDKAGQAVPKLLKKITDPAAKPSKEEVRSYYEEHKSEIMTGDAVRAAHIVRHINPEKSTTAAFVEITAAMEDLEKGMPFEQAVQKHSDCTSNGGDLGFFERGMMVQEFEDVAFSLGPGERSGVFLTQFGYHILMVKDRRYPQPVPFDKAAPQIAQLLLNHRKQKLVEDYLDSLKKTADIRRTEIEKDSSHDKLQ